MNQNTSSAIPNTNPAEHEVFEILTGIEELVLTARKLKAVTTAFDNTFCEHVNGVDIDEIRARPEQFCYLFEALRDYVCQVLEQAQDVDRMGAAYMNMKRAQKAAESPTAPTTDSAGENHCGDLEAPTAPIQTAQTT